MSQICISVFVVITFAVVAAAQETRIQTFSAEQAVSGDTDLEIFLDAEGDVLLQSSGVSTLTIVVTITAETAARLDNIQVQYQDANSSTIKLKTQDLSVTECDSGAELNTSSLSALVCSVFVSLLLTRWSGLSGSKWIFLLGLALSVVAVQVYAFRICTRADVTVLVPRNFTFNDVMLSSRRGSVQIDSQFLEMGSALTCSSGLNNNACDNCCNGNGKCEDGGCQCNSGYRGGEEENCATQTESSFQIHTSPSDPTILTIETIDSEQIQVFGDKDEDGNALSIGSLTFDDASGNTTSVAFNPNTTLIDRIGTSSGDYLNFEWSEDLESVRVTGVSSDGTSQITIHISLNSSVPSTDIRRSVQSIHSEEVGDNQHNLKKRQSTSGGVATILVDVKRCIQPEPDAEVFATAYLDYQETATGFESDGETTYQAFPTHVPGTFDIRIPVEPRSTIASDVAEICTKAADAVGKACTVLGILDKYTPIKVETVICNALRAHPIGRLLALACDRGFRALRTYCSTLGASIVPVDPIVGTATGVPNYASIICDGISAVSGNLDQIIDSSKTTNILLQPYAVFPDGYTISALNQVVELHPGIGGLTVAQFTIQDDRTLPEITSLTVSPPDPAPNQDYVAVITYVCASSTTLITMSIVGTDGYTNEIHCFGELSSCVLNVPGAHELVVDTVTIVISESTQGYTFTRTVTVVF